MDERTNLIYISLMNIHDVHQTHSYVACFVFVTAFSFNCLHKEFNLFISSTSVKSLISLLALTACEH